MSEDNTKDVARRSLTVAEGKATEAECQRLNIVSGWLVATGRQLDGRDEYEVHDQFGFAGWVLRERQCTHPLQSEDATTRTTR